MSSLRRALDDGRVYMGVLAFSLDDGPVCASLRADGSKQRGAGVLLARREINAHSCPFSFPAVLCYAQALLGVLSLRSVQALLGVCLEPDTGLTATSERLALCHLCGSSAKAAIKTAFLKEEDDDDESALACPSPHHFFSVMCIQDSLQGKKEDIVLACSTVTDTAGKEHA
eukprot:1147351-Pelagomonas_calceolata.AAC.2